LDASSIEYREAYRGFSIRVLSEKDGLFSIRVEGGRGSDAAKIEVRLGGKNDSGAQKYQSFESALQSIEVAKCTIDDFLGERGD
jgi:hypothetical protein